MFRRYCVHYYFFATIPLSISIFSGRLKYALDQEEADYGRELALLRYEQHLEWSRKRLDIHQQRVFAQKEADKAFLERKLQQREMYEN